MKWETHSEVSRACCSIEGKKGKTRHRLKGDDGQGRFGLCQGVTPVLGCAPPGQPNNGNGSQATAGRDEGLSSSFQEVEH